MIKAITTKCHVLEIIENFRCKAVETFLLSFSSVRFYSLFYPDVTFRLCFVHVFNHIIVLRRLFLGIIGRK
jgi:hypothetical protein